MYSKKKGEKLLKLVQILYQQDVISMESKTKLAKSIQHSFSTKSFCEVRLLWKCTPCLRLDKEWLFNQYEQIIGGR